MKEKSFEKAINAQSYHMFLYPFQWKGIDSLEKAEAEITKYNEKSNLCWNKIWPSYELNAGKKFGNTYADRMLYKTYQYFNDSARDLVLGRDDVALKYELCDKENAATDWKMYIDELELDLLSVKLDIYEFGVGIISFEIAYPGKSRDDDQDLSLNDLLYNINLINEKGRRLFPPYLPESNDDNSEQDGENSSGYKITADSIYMDFSHEGKKCTMKQWFSTSGNDFNPTKQNGKIEINNVLPTYITNLIPFKVETITDDRMFCCSLIMNDEAANKIQLYREGECGDYTEELYKFAFVENFASCTSIPMRKKILQESIYDRWVKLGTIYASTHHSFMSIMESVSIPGRPVFLVENFVELYVSIVKIVLLQRAELLVFLRRASELARNTRDYGQNYEKLLEDSNKFKQDYSRFLNEFMLPEVSSEEQAVDLYDLVQEQLYIKQMKESLTEQIQILYDITQSLVEHQKQNFNKRLEHILAIISFVGVWYGFAQVFFAFSNSVNTPTVCQIIVERISVLLPLVLIIVSFIVFKKRKK